MMDMKRYAVVMKENEGKVFDLHLSAWDVGLLASALDLALASPEVREQYSEKFMQTLRDLQKPFLALFQQMGFTAEELEHLTRRAA